MTTTTERKYQVISADGHVEVPPEAWVKYVPSQHKDRAPRLIKLPQGGEGWVVEGMPMLHNGQNISGGKPIKFRNDSYYNPDGSPAAGAGPAQQRLREQDLDGVDAEVLYPPVFATRFIEGIADKRAYLSMVQAYNTFLGQEYCAVAPDRLIGNGVIPITGIDDAVAEMKRCQELGLRSVSLHEFPNGGGGPAPEDDRFWETALDIGMRISPHKTFGSEPKARVSMGEGTGNADFSWAMAKALDTSLYPIVQMMLAGVFERFPELRLYFAETHAGWIPYDFFKLDDYYSIYKPWFGEQLKRPPTDYIRQHCLFSFIRDPIAMKLRDFLPWENLMWGSDFPHSVGSYPESRKWLAIIFEDVPEHIKRKVLLENPADFFGLDVEAPITPTP